MGDGGWRRIDAAPARHILTRVGPQALGTALHRLRPFPLRSRGRQRGQKPLAALRYSIAVALRRIRI
jgi:hypothetical protein